MAILDTLITQLDPDGRARAAARTRKGLNGPEQQPWHAAGTAFSQATPEEREKARIFRQEVMGALALFTGGRSLAGLEETNPQAVQAGAAPGTFSTHPETLLHGLTGLQQVGLPPTALPDTPAGRAGPCPPASRPAMQAMTGRNAYDGAYDGPSAPGSPLPDWAALLARASGTARQALREVEPTLHNAEQAMARFARHETASPGMASPQETPVHRPASPATSLLDLSALMTARSILTIHTPASKQAGKNAVPGHRPAPTTGSGQQAGLTGAHQPFPMADGSPAGARAGTEAGAGVWAGMDSWPHPRQDHTERSRAGRNGSGRNGMDRTAATRLEQLARMLVRAGRMMDRDPSAGGVKTARDMARMNGPETMTPSLARLAGRIDTTARHRHVTTHNSTTHGPTINVTVHGGHASPAEIGRMAHRGISRALERQQNGRLA